MAAEEEELASMLEVRAEQAAEALGTTLPVMHSPEAMALAGAAEGVGDGAVTAL
jgi:hypothetical protein